MILCVPDYPVVQEIYLMLQTDAIAAKLIMNSSRGNPNYSRILSLTLAYEKSFEDYKAALEADRLYDFMASWH